MTEKTLDLVGLKCPLPYLRTKKALAQAQVGDVLLVITTDPLAVIDIPNLCRETGNSVDILERTEARTRFRIEKR